MCLKIADLFAGVGGIALGFKNNGFKIGWANEIDKNACITYRKNFDHKLIEDDIKNLKLDTLEDVDIITAGFPCQPFSIAGLRKGFRDDRGNLFFEIMKVVDCKKPEILFFENVKNLATHDNGNTFNKIKEELIKRSYFLKYKILNTFEYSEIPQNRERIYILAFKDVNIYNKFVFPNKIEKHKDLSYFIFPEVENKYYYNRFSIYDNIKNLIHDNKIYQWRRIYLRENKNNVCPTLTANMGTGGHNVPLVKDKKDIRKLTPRECFNLQGFPNTYILPANMSDACLYKQAGNSVSVSVIEAIAKNLKCAIEGIKIKNNEYDLFDYIEKVVI